MSVLISTIKFSAETSTASTHHAAWGAYTRFDFNSVALKEIAKALFKYALFKDGKFSAHRTFFLLLWFAGAYITYAIVPTKIIPILLVIPLLEEIGWIQKHVANLKLGEYLQLAQLYYLSLYCLVSLLVALIKNGLGQQRVAELSETDRSILRFVREVQLANWYRCSNDDERRDAVTKIVEKIESSKRTRIMVIHGYHDIVKPDSVVRKALDNKGRNLHLQVLLLDPFSKYAVERAKQLRQETDIEKTMMRYIRDHVRVIQSLDEFKKKPLQSNIEFIAAIPFSEFIFLTMI